MFFLAGFDLKNYLKIKRFQLTRLSAITFCSLNEIGPYEAEKASCQAITPPNKLRTF